MEREPLKGPWRLKRNGDSVVVVRPDASVVASLLPARVAEAYAIAAAPQLLGICTRIKSVLENNLVVTSEGFKIDCDDLRKDLLTVILRAKGYRKSPNEP
jgi:hypothetical protein